MSNRLTSSLLLVCLLALGLVMFGCAAAEHKGATGAGLGALGGAATGAAIGSAFGSPGLGAAIGAGGGALIGKTVGDEMAQKEQKRETEELRQRVQELEATKKAATPETAERRLIDGRWHVKRYIEDPPASGRYKEIWVAE